jgi:hypothetical protein
LIVLAQAAWNKGLPWFGRHLSVLGRLTMYLSWPYLWATGEPFRRALQHDGGFSFNSMVLFASQLYKPTGLPITYFPTLLAIQLTESALLLIAAGLVVSVINFIGGRNRAVLWLLVAWFLLPLLVIIAARSPLYDNGRQLYFLLPPLFIAGGAALDRLFERFHLPSLRGAVLLAAALPGILIGARLHPYEYVYYNALVKGTGGAFRSYETDYWGTSFDEVSAYMNVHLPAGSKVLVYGPEQIVAAHARTDLAVFIPREDVDPGYDYVVLLTRSNADQRLCRGTEKIFSVGRRGAVFSELRRIPAATKCQQNLPAYRLVRYGSSCGATGLMQSGFRAGRISRRSPMQSNHPEHRSMVTGGPDLRPGLLGSGPCKCHRAAAALPDGRLVSAAIAFWQVQLFYTAVVPS